LLIFKPVMVFLQVRCALVAHLLAKHVLIETIMNGVVVNEKYDSGVKVFDKPLVLILLTLNRTKMPFRRTFFALFVISRTPALSKCSALVISEPL